jgi:hypothetical protein
LLLSWPVIAAVVLIAVVVLLLVVGGGSGSDSPAIPPPGPRHTQAGIPVGYADTSAGASAAATEYVIALGGRPGVDPASRPAALAAVTDVNAASEVAARLVDRAGAEDATGLVSAWTSGQPLVARVLPLTAEVTSFTPSSAVVTVWTLAVLGTQRMGQVTAGWSTERLSLVWQGDWKIRDWTSGGGPTPAMYQPTTALSEFLTADAGMRQVPGATAN